MVRLQDEPIVFDTLLDAVASPAAGAVATFLGTVRDHNEGRRVTRLEYHAYPEMAVREMEKLEALARERFDVAEVAIVHRTGALEIGEASVAIAVSSAHRASGIDACRFLIDTLKQTVPIWKKEFFEGGDVWLEGYGGAKGGPPEGA